MSALDQLYSAIEKAGLIKPGKPSLMRRVGFLLSTGSNERNYKIGRYLEGRKAGKGYGPKGKRRARTGTYTGVYATGINKSELSMSALDELDEVIEKARGLIPRGGSSKLARRIARQGAKLQSKGGEPKEGKRFSALGTLANRRKGNAFGVKGGRGYVSVQRRGVYKSNDTPTALDQLDEAIEKARGRGLMPKGGSLKLYPRISGGGARNARIKNYLLRRTANIEGRVKKK